MIKFPLPPDVKDDDLRPMSFHEAGHALVAEHYNFNWSFIFTPLEIFRAKDDDGDETRRHFSGSE